MQNIYYDFFAGGGMAGLGLGPSWVCQFANEIDPKKAVSYRANHGGGPELLVDDVANVQLSDVPGSAGLVWASFPCQDLSLAGKGAGLAGKRSGAFKPFWSLLEQLCADGRAPKIIALENVVGAITSNGGTDFSVLSDSFAKLGYVFGAIVIDAVRFLPQSRPRFFMVGVRSDLDLPSELTTSVPSADWHPSALVQSFSSLSVKTRENWRWWKLPVPSIRNTTLSSVIESNPDGVEWHSVDETNYLLSMMTENNLKKVELAKASRSKVVGTIYRRTRRDSSGVKRQRAEVRFDQIAGCLRTPAGGSSRQTIMVVEGEIVRTRLLASTEAAALMGLPKDYILPARYNDAYKLAGDGVAVPVVRHLSSNLFEPILNKNRLALVA